MFGVDASTEEGKTTMKMLNVKKTPIIIIKLAIQNKIPTALSIIV